MTLPEFRQLYPPFADPGFYRDLIVQSFMTEATARLSSARWGALLDIGVGLFVAHNLTLWAKDQQNAMAGNLPGEVKGPLTSRTVDTVSNSWDSKAGTYEDAGWWNLTTYGLRFYQMARGIGMGGMQL